MNFFPTIKKEKMETGQRIKSPFDLCTRPMYPMVVYMCFYCQKRCSERECFQYPSGKTYFSIPLCSRCVEYNRASQEAGRTVLEVCEREKLINTDSAQEN